MKVVYRVLGMMVIGITMFVAAGVLGKVNLRYLVGAAGNTYYVSTSGNDSNSGSQSAPVRTINAGVAKLSSGDTLYIRSGTYRITRTLTIATPNVTIATAPGDQMAVISGDTNGDGKAETPGGDQYGTLIDLEANNIVFKNLEVEYSTGRGIRIGSTSSSVSGITVSGCNVHHIWNSGIWVYSPYAKILNNTVWRAADINYCNLATGRQCNGNWPGALAWGEAKSYSAPGSAHHIQISGNTVYNNSGEGLLCMHSDNGVINNNVVYDNWALNIDLDKCSNYEIKNNLIYFTNNKAWWKGSGRPGAGIMLANEHTLSSGDPYPVGRNRKIINNIMVGTGIYWWAADGNFANNGLHDEIIAYNTIVESSGTGQVSLKIDGGGTHSNTQIRNNIIAKNDGEFALSLSYPGITFSNNLWSRTPPSGVRGTNSIVADPKLVDQFRTRNPGQVQAGWYKLTSGSPAIGQAYGLTGITTDFFGASRGSSSDIGAHEYGANAPNVTPLPTIVPTTPPGYPTVKPTVKPTNMPPTPIVAPTNVKMNPSEDATVVEKSMYTNFGKSTTLQVDGTEDYKKTYIKFDLTGLAGKTVTKATLRVKTTSEYYARTTDQVKLTSLYRSDSSWSESSISYGSRPLLEKDAISTWVPRNSNTWYSMDATAIIAGREGKTATVAFMMNGNDGIELYSREGAYPPELEIVYR